MGRTNPKQQLQYTWQVLFLVCFTEKLKNNKCWNGKDKPITAIYNKIFLIDISTISGSLQLRDLFNFQFFVKFFIANFALLQTYFFSFLIYFFFFNLLN